MRPIQFPVSLSAIVWLAVTVASAAFADSPTDARYAGASRTSPIADDMTFSAVNRVAGSGRLGAFALDGLESWIWDLSQTCPRTGDLPIRLVEGGSVVTYGSSAQLMLEAVSGLICLDIFTMAFEGHQHGTIVGGTGRFEGASGTYETEFGGEDVISELSRLAGSLTLEFDR